jgi:hypothetical protein
MDEGTKDRGCRNRGPKPFYWCPAILLVASFLGCGGVVGSGPPQPPPSVSVSVTPTSASVLLGEPQTFLATVSNATDTAVVWSVNGIPGGNAAAGTIDPSGVYTTPAILPASGIVTVQATSVADPSKSGAATVHVTSDIAVSLTPQTASMELGSSKTFIAAATSAGHPNLGIAWSVSGNGCAGSSCGVVSSLGIFTAPQNLPAPPVVTLTASSIADPSKSSSTTITITSSFTVSLTGPGQVYIGTVADYAAAVIPAPNSNPNPMILWSVSAAGCSGAACGTISASGAYTAPTVPPTPATLQVTATPAADPSKAVSFPITILATTVVTLSPIGVTLAPSGTQAFHAHVVGVQNTSVTWDVNGIVGGNASVGMIQNSQTDPSDTTYTSPQTVPPGGSVTVRASSNANPNISANAIVSFATGINITLAPLTATRVTGHRQTFTAQVNYTGNQNISWAVNGIAGGNLSVGQICVSGSNPCQQVSLDAGGLVDYLAPAGIPFPNPMTVTATSQFDGTTKSSASVTILPHLVLSITPGSAALANAAEQQFAASVLGAANQQVIWNIAGSGCGTPPACGTINSAGLYVAPATPPTPNLIEVIATSSEDSTQTATATVTISGGSNVSLLTPSSAYAGSAGGFTLLLSGSNFLPSSPGPGSTVLIAGTPRTALCASSTQCTTSLTAADLQTAGNISVQAQNPGGSASNSASFVVLAPGSSAGTIPLTPGAPSATGKDIVVVELSSNGDASTSGSAPLNIAAIGAYTVGSNSCVLADSAVVITRPASGVATADVCVFSISGLDPSFTYSISGPPVPDIVILNRASLGFGILQLTLQVPATAAAGPRTLFVQNPSMDMAAGTGAIEVH